MTKVAAKKWPVNDLERVISCPVCNSPDREKLYSGLTDRVFFVAPGEWTLWQCSNCDTAYIDPRPTEASIGRAYESYYTHHDPEMPAPTSAYQHLRAALGNGYRNSRYGTQLQPSMRLGKIIGQMVPQLRTPIDCGYRWLPRHGKSQNVLDVGCGSGAWLEVARDAGWNVFGIEPDPVSRAMAEAKGITVWPTIDQASEQAPVFHHITLSHVIEHVHDPVGLLRSCIALLEPGASIFVETPNIDAIGREIFGVDWLALDPPRHLMLFNRGSMKRILKESGFRKMSFKTRRMFGAMSRQSSLISAGMDPFSTDQSLGRRQHSLRVRARTGLTRRRSEYLTVIAEKPR